MHPDFTLQHEPRPRDFSARIRRSRMRGLAASRRKRAGARHALLLIGAVALPAFAAPDEWQRFEIGDAGAAEVAIEPMPFEQPGSSFPGSAFYYLAADEPAPPPALGEAIHSDAESGPVASVSSPAARSMYIDQSGVDRTRALQCLTAAVYYEAASESDSGQRAVAQVVLNRVAHPAYPDTVCGVVYQGSERTTGCQFSFTCDGSLARKPVRMFWLRAENVARAALAGYVHSPIGLATHYHTIQVHPVWASKLAYLGTIGAHRFYRFGGAVGSPGAFRFAYGGGEPLAVPHARPASALIADSLAALEPGLARADYTQAPGTAQAVTLPAFASAPGPGRPPLAQTYSPGAPVRDDARFRGSKLPDSTGIRPEYRNSGRWIAEPGT